MITNDIRKFNDAFNNGARIHCFCVLGDDGYSTEEYWICDDDQDVKDFLKNVALHVTECIMNGTLIRYNVQYR